MTQLNFPFYQRQIAIPILPVPRKVSFHGTTWLFKNLCWGSIYLTLPLEQAFILRHAPIQEGATLESRLITKVRAVFTAESNWFWVYDLGEDLLPKDPIDFSKVGVVRCTRCCSQTKLGIPFPNLNIYNPYAIPDKPQHSVKLCYDCLRRYAKELAGEWDDFLGQTPEKWQSLELEVLWGSAQDKILEYAEESEKLD